MDEHYVLFPPDFRPLPQHAGLFQGDNMAQKHPGFAAVQKKIEASGHSKESAGAILASASRGASKSAKSKNPRLARVK